MNDRERFEYEVERRLDSDIWNAAVAKRALKTVRRRRLGFVSAAGGLAAVVAVIAVSFVLFSGVSMNSEENTIVMQQVSGAYNAAAGIHARESADLVDAEIEDALWSR